ncbi:Hsp70 family protein [Leifsonia sp. YIM 134122]|uniref:Hsp70 family protein n=1 Tax=Leifsonia stereocauli TaxID=3134136 RepID=A0ABU9W0F1_9MICO
MNAVRAWSLSIDFGTSNTAAAYYRGGDTGPRVVRLGTHTDTIPSAVIIDTSGVIVGDSASNQMGIYPGEFREHPKLELGNEFIPVGSSQYSTTDVIAAILRHVRDRAVQANESTLPAEVILTHPADWGDTRKDALREAAVKAGFPAETVRLIEEPVAAAHYYGAMAGAPEIGERIAVFDFGGGTLDVALIERTASGYETVDSDGAQDLGGKDFDELLYEWVLTQMSEHTGADMGARLDAPQNLGMKLTLRDSVRKAKESLTTNETVKIPVAVPGFNDALIITGPQYREMIQPLVDRGVKLTQDLLAHHGGHADRIYLTGGASQTPTIRTSLEAALKQSPLTRDDLKLVVVEGALWVPKPQPQPHVETEEERAAREATEARAAQEAAATEAAAAAAAAAAAEAERSRTETSPADGEQHQTEEEETEAWRAAAEQNQKDAVAKKRRRKIIGWTAAAASVLVIGTVGIAIAIIPPPPPPPPPGPDDCSSSEVWDADLEACVAAEDPPGPEDCLSSEEWDSDLETCVAKEVDPVDPVDCWDGSTADTGSDCPALAGRAGLDKMFTADGASCVVVDLSQATGGLASAEEAMQCTWTDLPNTTVSISRYDQGAATFWSGYLEGTPEMSTASLLDAEGASVGTKFDVAGYDESGNNTFITSIWAYEDVPFSADIFTSVAQGGTLDENTQAQARVFYWDAATVDAIVAGSP